MSFGLATIDRWPFRSHSPKRGIDRNFFGSMLPYAAVMHRSGAKSDSFERKSSCRNERRPLVPEPLLERSPPIRPSLVRNPKTPSHEPVSLTGISVDNHTPPGSEKCSSEGSDSLDGGNLTS